MESILEPLEIMAWMMQDPNQKSFTIKDFFKSHPIKDSLNKR